MTTDKTIEEMNEVLAIFDGWELKKGDKDHLCARHDHNHPDESCTCYLKCDGFVKGNRLIYHYRLKYHEDWNQLIAVGKKIYDWLNEQQKQRPPHTATQGDLLEVDIHCAIKEYDIEKAHKAIYEFIQWFNTTTKQKD